jgi:hypothetical protein
MYNLENKINGHNAQHILKLTFFFLEIASLLSAQLLCPLEKSAISSTVDREVRGFENQRGSGNNTSNRKQGGNRISSVQPGLCADYSHNTMTCVFLAIKSYNHPLYKFHGS